MRKKVLVPPGIFALITVATIAAILAFYAVIIFIFFFLINWAFPHANVTVPQIICALALLSLIGGVLSGTRNK